jgi:hypothetical protein
LISFVFLLVLGTKAFHGGQVHALMDTSNLLGGLLPYLEIPRGTVWSLTQGCRVSFFKTSAEYIQNYFQSALKGHKWWLISLNLLIFFFFFKKKKESILMRFKGKTLKVGFLKYFISIL